MYTTTDVAQGMNVPVLINALQSPMDSGHVASLVSSHLTESLQSERVVNFDADSFLNYRQNRPAMTFEHWRYTDYTEPEIVLDLLRDDEGSPVLLLHGPEPDLRWNGFVNTVVSLVEKFGVKTTYSVQGIPMGVPHTRPVHLTLHATEQDLIGEQPELFGVLRIPANVSALLEYRLGALGHDAAGIAASVPHYLASSPYPLAAAAIVSRLSALAGLALPVGELEAAAAQLGVEIAEQISDQAEVRAVVKALEGQYDSFTAAQPQMVARSADVELPSADEIGAAAEAFLADLAQGDQDS